MRIILVLVVGWLVSGVASAQGVVDATEGMRRLQLYETVSGSIFGDYLCRVKVTASTAPDAKVFAMSEAAVTLARAGEVGYKAIYCQSEAIDGTPSRKRERFRGRDVILVEQLPALFSGRYELYTKSGQDFLLRAGRIERLAKGDVILGISPHEPVENWPLMTSDFLANGDTFGMPKSPVEYLKSWKCVSSENDANGRLRAVFHTHPQDPDAGLEIVVTFDEERIVRSTWTSFHRVEGKRLSFLQADVIKEWDTLLADPLPKLVSAKLGGAGGDYVSVDYSFEFEWFVVGSKEFNAFKDALDKVEPLMDKQLRTVAGAEEPKTPAPKK